MGWVRFNRGAGSNSNLQPFPGCRKAEEYAMDKRKRCSKWVCAERRPHLWTEERIAKSCKGCRYWDPQEPNGGGDDEELCTSQ